MSGDVLQLRSKTSRPKHGAANQVNAKSTAASRGSARERDRDPSAATQESRARLALWIFSPVGGLGTEDKSKKNSLPVRFSQARFSANPSLPGGIWALKKRPVFPLGVEPAGNKWRLAGRRDHSWRLRVCIDPCGIGKDAELETDRNLKLTGREIAASFAADGSTPIPPIMTIDEAASLLRIPKATLYDWRSRGLLSDCSRKIGKHVRFFRDRLIHRVFNEGLNQNGRRMQ
jgi:excisionase family DNA binding protein